MLSRDVVQQQLLAVFGMYPDISLAVALRMNANITAPFHTVKLSLSTMVSCGMVMETKQKGRLPSIYRLSEEGKRYHFLFFGEDRKVVSPEDLMQLKQHREKECQNSMDQERLLDFMRSVYPRSISTLMAHDHLRAFYDTSLEIAYTLNILYQLKTAGDVASCCNYLLWSAHTPAENANGS